MNLNGNISLRVPTTSDLKKLLPVLVRSQSILVGIALIGIFGYAALVVQKAINVKADAVTASSPLRFDVTTLNGLSGRSQVDGTTPSTPIGTTDPFGTN